jgi:hypothetical protein
VGATPIVTVMSTARIVASAGKTNSRIS